MSCRVAGLVRTIHTRTSSALYSTTVYPERAWAQLIDGQSIAHDLRTQVRADVEAVVERYGRLPKLGVVVVGDRSDSAKYVAIKQAAARSCGIETIDFRLPASASEIDVLQCVSHLNDDPTVDGILVQLPLPSHLDTSNILSAISVEKDVDGFHPQNLGGLARFGESYRYSHRKLPTPSNDPLYEEDVGEGSLVYDPMPLDDLEMNWPCTALGCIELLDRTNVDLKGKHVVVVGRSNVVGLPLALMCLHRDATITVCHVQTPQTDEEEGTNLKSACGLADVLVVAAGVPGLIKGHWLKRDAVVIDVGFNVVSVTADDGSEQEIICGDVCFEEARKVASHITPVPGGVGPMTVAMLMKNTFASYKRINRQRRREQRESEERRLEIEEQMEREIIESEEREKDIENDMEVEIEKHAVEV